MAFNATVVKIIKEYREPVQDCVTLVAEVLEDVVVRAADVVTICVSFIKTLSSEGKWFIMVPPFYLVDWPILDKLSCSFSYNYITPFWRSVNKKVIPSTLKKMPTTISTTMKCVVFLPHTQESLIFGHE